MRVLSGWAGGRPLKGPAIPGARPTSELVRGAIFNVLGPLEGKVTRSMDLFAGTGSLGIEALSRGVPQVDFVERNRRQCQRIRENLALIGMEDSASVHCMEVGQALQGLEGTYQLVLMDPPYKLEELSPVLDPLGASEHLDHRARVVVGHSKKVQLEERYGSLIRTANRRYGDSMVDFYIKEG